MSPDPAELLDADARAKLETILTLLAEERASVSSVVDARAWQVHVVDSLTGLEVPELRQAKRIADIGAGAGFPGLVLAVALPDAEVDLIESVGRKCAFMQSAIQALRSRMPASSTPARRIGRPTKVAKATGPLPPAQ